MASSVEFCGGWGCKVYHAGDRWFWSAWRNHLTRSGTADSAEGADNAAEHALKEMDRELIPPPRAWK